VRVVPFRRIFQNETIVLNDFTFNAIIEKAECDHMEGRKQQNDG
jgi:hypothetical protein